MKLTNNHNPRERERERESKLLRQAQDKSSSRLIQFIKKESHKPFFYASLFFALLLLLTVIYQLAFSWNPPTAGAPGPSGQTLYSDTNRNIGIGTLYPSVKLEIYSTSSDSILKLSRQSATSTLFKVGTDSAFVINSNGADRLTISSNGNVGIGTTAPEATLQVNGSMKILGVAEVKAFGTVYQASTDGFVTVNLYYNRLSYSFIKGYTDSSNPPTTLVAGDSTAGNYLQDYGSISFPVRKGNYWKVENTGDTPNSYRIQWTPLGI